MSAPTQPQAAGDAATFPIPLCVSQTRKQHCDPRCGEFYEVLLCVGNKANSGNCVATVVMSGKGGTDRTRDAVEKFADYVARACNSHAALVEALESLIAAESASADQFTAKEIDAIEAAMTKAHAALAAAKQGGAS